MRSIDIWFREPHWGLTEIHWDLRDVVFNESLTLRFTDTSIIVRALWGQEWEIPKSKVSRYRTIP